MAHFPIYFTPQSHQDNSNVSSPNILSQNLQFSGMKRKTTTTLRIAIIVFLAIALCTFYHDGLPSLYAIRPFNYLFKNFKQIDDKDILENLSLTDDQCRYYFPGLMKEIDNAVARGPFDLKRAPDEYTGLVQVRIKDGKRIHALLNQLNRALITTSVASSIPDTILTLTVHDTPRNNSISYSLPFPPLPNSNYWVMPHFSFWSWPLPFIGPLPLALQSISSIEASTPWESKIDKAIWRGTAYYNGLVNTNLRPKLIEVTKDKEWADVQNLKWGTNGETAKNAIAIEDFCRWKYLIYTEGVTYSGRLPFHQACASVLLTPPLTFLMHTTHLIRPLFSSSISSSNSPSPEYPWPSQPPNDANAIFVSPDWSDLERTIFWLRENSEVAQGIASRQRDLMTRYLSPASEVCYWRALIRGWAAVATTGRPELGWEDEGNEGTSWETWSLTGRKMWY